MTAEAEKYPTTDKMQTGLRVLKISDGAISLPSQAGGIPKLTSSDFEPVDCT